MDAEKQLPETIGHTSGSIPVEISTRFLEHFSEQLYSSPQKAFEELISNSWDAGANCVDIRISTDLNDPNATMCVLDNGVSMDEEGLKQLWHIAFSPKKGKTSQFGRQVIGQFGIGKLATYVLANKLTYICKASDGVIRRVTMDYSAIDRQTGGSQDKLISELTLDLYEVDESEVEEALSNVFDGTEILELIKKGIPAPSSLQGEDEFGALKSTLQRETINTWTLVVLSSIKPTGKDLKIGVLKRMLEAALPLGSEMAISLNGQLLSSSKINNTIDKEWIIGPDLAFNEIEVEEEKESHNENTNEGSEKPKHTFTKIPVIPVNTPFPAIDIPGIGIVTGKVKLYEDSITGGKSEDRGSSNGFQINVLGRIVNQENPSFGEKDLSHAAWARFRMTVRADGLNKFLTTDREKFKERRELKIFRAFLRKVFNTVRKYYDSDAKVGLPHGGDVLVQSLGVLSLNPLRNVVSEALKAQPPLSDLFDESGIQDREEKRRSWRENTADNIRNALGQVKYERINDDSFVKFRLSDNSIVVNTDHPFVAEYSRSKAEKELVRTFAMINLLTDIYALDIGVFPAAMESVRDFRDRLMRYRALQTRQSGVYIAKLLLQTQNESDHPKRFEAVLSDALRYLGFDVRDLAKNGEPEGIASAYPLPTTVAPTSENRTPPLYNFSFDAKSSKHENAKTGNLSHAGIAEHRNTYKAKYALVVAPGFSEGANTRRCTELQITPMTARDLGKLLEYTVEYGAIPLQKLEEVFKLYNHEHVASWVKNLENWLKSQRSLTIDIFLKALDNLKGQVPDALPAGVISLECRRVLNIPSVLDKDVISLAQGLSVLIPDLIGVDGDKIVVNASVQRVAASINAQLEKLHNNEPV